MQNFLDIVSDNRVNGKSGIYAICTAHPMVLEAALQQGKKDGTPVLIEATANQVNQFGGYTGMKPADFPAFIMNIADKVGFPKEDLILGGDHLGPVVWCGELPELAMAKAEDLIQAYVAAGFKKIHLDTSMACSGDPEALSDDVVASRAAALCRVAENTAIREFGSSELVYVVGTEVPPPGGATEELASLEVTPPEAVQKTVAAHKQAFLDAELSDAWSRVIGIVVQPGVEFDHTTVHDFEPQKAGDLKALITQIPNIVYEAHSTDYQPSAAYPALVENHFAILKVGPQLTFALREALFALSYIEDELVAAETRSNLRQACDEVMLEQPENWVKYYPNQEPQSKLYRRYSYSDRIRYYWNNEQLSATVEKLISNLSDMDIPLPLISQCMPFQYDAVRSGAIKKTPEHMIRHHIMRVTACYANACASPAA